MAKKIAEYSIGINYDINKSGLEEMKKQLQNIQNLGVQDLDVTSYGKQGEQELTKLKKSAQELEKALDKAFDTRIGTLNLKKFDAELKKIGTDSLKQIAQQFDKISDKSSNAFKDFLAGVSTTNLRLKETNNLVDRMGKSLASTIRYTISTSLINSFTGMFQQAYGYVKNLDTSLNDIRIVTGKSADEMDRFAVTANRAAKDLASSTVDYTKASLIYFQQGLSDEEVAARAGVTLKAANVTGQSTAEVSELLTAVWNGYKVSAQEAELYVDKLAAVAGTTASDLEELSVGMSKVASAANSMGVDVDQLNAQLATIVSVTRQAPESVGTALKTIYARMGDLSVDGEDEFGTSLGEVSSKMKQMGVDVLDLNGDLRDIGIVVEEVAGKWNTWTAAQKQAAAVAMAGKRLEIGALIA